MGFVKRYWQEAEEKNIPHWRTCVIVELVTGEARVQLRAFANISKQSIPELPKTFPTYEEAFMWLERKLTQRAPDFLKAVKISKPESVKVESALPAISG